MVLRDVTQDDCYIMYMWVNDPDVRNNSFNQNRIDYDTHSRWFTKSLVNPDRKIYILEVNNVSVGMIRFDRVEEKAYIDYSIQDDHRGLGLGSALIEMGCKKIRDEWDIHEIIGEVKLSNLPSQKVFRKIGFTEFITFKQVL